MEIAPHVHLIPRVFGHPYLIVEPNGLTLIDTGIKGSHKRILTYVTQLGHVPSDLARILITHADVDHIGGLAALQAATHARVYANAIEASAIAAGRASRPLRVNPIQKFGFVLLTPLLKPLPAHVDEILVGGQILPVLGGLRVIDTFGHTPGHVSFFSPSTGILFSGDSLVPRRGRLVGSSGGITWDQEKANLAVNIQAVLGVRMVCAGHGPVIRDPDSRLPKV